MFRNGTQRSLGSWSIELAASPGVIGVGFAGVEARAGWQRSGGDHAGKSLSRPLALFFLGR